MNADRSLTIAGRHRHWGVPPRVATVAEADTEHPKTRRRRSLRRAIGDRSYWWLRFAYRLPVYRRMEQSLQLRMQLGLPFNSIPLDDGVCVYSPDDLLCYCIFLDMATSAHTREEHSGFIRLAQGCSKMLDVGASAGYYSAVFAQVCPAPGKVVSIEPEARSFALLQECRQLNGKPGIEWLVFNCGLAEADRLVKFKPTSELGTTVDESDRDAIEIECKTLRSICREAAITPDLVKIDIESYEYEVLMVSIDFLSEFKPRLHLELHSPQLRKRGLDAADLLQRLEALGYRPHGQSSRRRTPLPMLLRAYEIQHFDLAAD
jgi:FkbM family methyltransferase